MAEHNGPKDPSDSESGGYGEFRLESESLEPLAKSGFELPPWTDPPTGEIPKVLSELDLDDNSMKSRLSSLRFSSFFGTEAASGSLSDALDERSSGDRGLTRRELRESRQSSGYLASARASKTREPISSRPVAQFKGRNTPATMSSNSGAGVNGSENDSVFGIPQEVPFPSKRFGISLPKFQVSRSKRSVGNKGVSNIAFGSERAVQSDEHTRVEPHSGPAENGGVTEANQANDELAPASASASMFRPSSFSSRKEKLAKLPEVEKQRHLPFARIATGLGLGLVVLIAFHFGPVTALGIVSLAIVFATIEFYDTVRRAGYRPATLLGIAGVLSLMLTTYTKGANGAPLVFAFLVVASMLWYLLGVIRGNPTKNISITFLGVLWIGGLGSFAAAILRPQDFPHSHGVAYLLGAIIATVANDTVAYFFGSWFGRHKMAPDISPTKSWEGLVAGTVASILVSALVVSQISPWNVTRALMLGIIVAVMAPIGDLSESMIKRDLHIKDMGKLLPGHGGMLDRIDGLIFVLPTVYYLLKILKLS